MNQIENLSFSQKWIQQHKKQGPIFLVIIGLNVLLEIVVYNVVPDRELLGFTMSEIAWFTDCLILPLAAINAVFFGTWVLGNSTKTGWRNILVKVILAVTGVAIASTGLEFIYSSFGYIDDDHLNFGDYQVDPFWTNVISYSCMALAIALPIFIWKNRLTKLNNRLVEKELEQEKLVQLKVQAELHALQSRINPHFLFNSFNSIASLISIDPVGAENMVVKLSELFRYSLNSQETHFVSIEEELNIVETYLEIEKVRFGDNLLYELEVDKELFQEKIPRFLLQPLVENAIKHALSKIKKGQLKVKIEKKDEFLEIEVFDNGPEFPEPKVLGYGLKSTYDKLKLLYPGGHDLKFVNAPNKKVHISLNQNKKGLENV